MKIEKIKGEPPKNTRGNYTKLYEKIDNLKVGEFLKVEEDEGKINSLYNCLNSRRIYKKNFKHSKNKNIIYIVKESDSS